MYNWLIIYITPSSKVLAVTYWADKIEDAFELFWRENEDTTITKIEMLK